MNQNLIWIPKIKASKTEQAISRMIKFYGTSLRKLGVNTHKGEILIEATTGNTTKTRTLTFKEIIKHYGN